MPSHLNFPAPYGRLGHSRIPYHFNVISLDCLQSTGKKSRLYWILGGSAGPVAASRETHPQDPTGIFMGVLSPRIDSSPPPYSR